MRRPQGGLRSIGRNANDVPRRLVDFFEPQTPHDEVGVPGTKPLVLTGPTTFCGFNECTRRKPNGPILLRETRHMGLRSFHAPSAALPRRGRRTASARHWQTRASFLSSLRHLGVSVPLAIQPWSGGPH